MDDQREVLLLHLQVSAVHPVQELVQQLAEAVVLPNDLVALLSEDLKLPIDHRPSEVLALPFLARQDNFSVGSDVDRQPTLVALRLILLLDGLLQNEVLLAHHRWLQKALDLLALGLVDEKHLLERELVCHQQRHFVPKVLVESDFDQTRCYCYCFPS